MTDPSESPNQPIARGSFERLLRHGRARYLRFRRSFPRLIRTDEVWLVLLAGVVGLGAGLIVATMIAILVDEIGRYAGIVLVAHAHGPEVDVETVAELALNPKDVLLPQMNVRETASLFESSKSEELTVVDDRATLRVVGLLTEQYALRRYNAELDSRSRDTATV